MMFKKGSFEIGATVYPVAIKVICVLLPLNTTIPVLAFIPTLG